MRLSGRVAMLEKALVMHARQPAPQAHEMDDAARARLAALLKDEDADEE